MHSIMHFQVSKSLQPRPVFTQTSRWHVSPSPNMKQVNLTDLYQGTPHLKQVNLTDWPRFQCSTWGLHTWSKWTWQTDQDSSALPGDSTPEASEPDGLTQDSSALPGDSKHSSTLTYRRSKHSSTLTYRHSKHSSTDLQTLQTFLHRPTDTPPHWPTDSLTSKHTVTSL